MAGFNPAIHARKKIHYRYGGQARGCLMAGSQAGHGEVM